MKLVRSLALLCSVSLPLQAQSTWYVDVAATPPGNGSVSAPYSSIQFAIDQSTTLSGDTLLVAPGTYAESLRFFGKSIVLKGGSGAATTILQSSTQPHAAIRWIDGEGLGTRLEGFTVQGALNNASSGGGLECVGTIGEVRDCVFLGCGTFSGPGGGASLANGADVNFIRVEFLGCFSFVSGGGMSVSDSRARAVECDWRGGNAFTGSGSGLGGGIRAQASTLEIENCEFIDNSTDGAGGGLSLNLSSAQILESRFEENRCDAPGGAIWAIDSTLTASKCWFERSTIFFGSGFALYSNRPATTHVRSSVFLDNYTSGLASSSAAVAGATLARCTLMGNISSPFLDVAAAQDCSLSNCIVWGNLPSTNPLSNCTVRYSDVEGGASGVGNIDFDPLFVDLAGDDLRLLPGSPCINSGDPASFPDPDGSRADMGAFPWIPEIEAYCTGKLNSAGCVPTVAWVGRPSYTTDDFHVIAVNALNNKTGLLFYGFAPRSDPFLGGTLCVAPPTVRTPLQNSGGVVLGNNCTGAWAFSFDAAFLQSAALAPDTLVYAQFWGRDPGFAPPNSAMLSNAVRFRVEH